MFYSCFCLLINLPAFRKLQIMSRSLRGTLKFSNYIRKEQFHASSKCNSTQFLKTEKIVQEHWEDKMKVWLKKYEDLFGITKLSEMHERVLKVQNNLQVIQEKRRKVQEEVFIVQKKLQEMQDILHKTSMGDDMYISVVTQVRELLKEQKRLQDVFSLYDQTEREQQTTLALSINNSQDHERTYREKNKYLSLITGVVGGVIGLLGSSINNWRHRKDIKVFASDISNQVNGLQQNVEKLSSVVSSTVSNKMPEVNAKVNENLVLSEETQFFLTQMKAQQEILQNNVKTLHSLVHDNIANDYETREGFYLDIHIKKLFNQLEDNIDSKLNYHTSLNVGLISTLFLFGSFILYIYR